jgi:hypothetical protein
VRKARRAKEHNEGLSPAERRSLPRVEVITPAQEADQQGDERDAPNEDRFDEGDQAWLFIKKVKPGLKKKLAHRWHGPFRIKQRVEEFTFEFELPNRSGYRFHPIVHV